MGNKVITIGRSSTAAYANVDEATNQSYVYKDVSMNATLKADVNSLSMYNDIAYVLAKEDMLQKIVTEADDETILLYAKSSVSLSKKADDYVKKLRELSYADLSAQLEVKSAGFNGNQISVYLA